MKLHIFNPEHDIALAHNDPYFTAPHAGRQLRADFGFLPAVWAEDGDMVLVDDVESSLAHVRHLGSRAKDVVFLTKADLRHSPFAQLPMDGKEDYSRLEIVPWGWNVTLRHQLRKSLVNNVYLPDDQHLERIREFSNRRFSADVLSAIAATDERFVGESKYMESIEMLMQYKAVNKKVVVKAPWSSSGRGVRYLDGDLSESDLCWVKRVILQQGGIMAEPYYNKVKDFAMEFYADGCQVHYLGLSLFDAVRGAYAGNVLASESVKREEMKRYVSLTLLDQLQNSIIDRLSPIFKHAYRGPFGVDMMVCATLNDHAGTMNNKSFLLHPCVEINMRRTMGHVALAMTPSLPGLRELLRIDYENTRYHLRIYQEKNQINTDIL